MHSIGGHPLLRRLARDGFVMLAAAFVGLRLLGVPPWERAVDAYAYWATGDGSMYQAANAGDLGAYLYSPAFAQVLGPFTHLPWQVFLAAWTALLLAAYGWTVRALALPLLLFLAVPADIATGNIHLLYAAAIVLGFRVPAAWALMALTKVTPFVGVAWFAARREWRSLAVACGVTAAIAAASFVVDPDAWRAWITILTTSSSVPVDTPGWYVPVALAVRLPIALLVVVVAARTDRAWLLPVGVTLALPVLWFNGLAVLVACVPLWSWRPAVRAGHAAADAASAPVPPPGGPAPARKAVR